MRSAPPSVQRASELAALIQGLYGALRMDQGWNGWLAQLCTTLRCTGAILSVQQKYGPVVLGSCGSVTDSAARAAGPRHLVNLPFPSFEAERASPPRVLAVTHRQDTRNPDTRNDADGWLPAAIDREDGAATLELALDATRTALTPAELDVLDVVAAHLQQALALHQHIAALRNVRDSLVAIADRLAAAVIAVNDDERVVFANRAARRLLERGDALRLHRQTLVGTTAAATADLRKLIGAAVHVAVNGGATSGASGGAMRLVDAASGKSLKLVAVPVSAPAQAPFSEPIAAVLFAGDAAHDYAQSTRAAADIFGLTFAETRVLAGLLSGETLEGVAKQAKLSKNTVRSQLQHIFNKTNTHNQTDLVRSVLSIPAVSN